MRVDVTRQRKLDENAVDGGIGVEAVDDRQQRVLRDVGGVGLQDGVHAEFCAGLGLHARVEFGGGVVADEHDGEAGHDAAFGFQALDIGFDFTLNLLANGLSINDRCHYSVSSRGFQGMAVTARILAQVQVIEQRARQAVTAQQIGRGTQRVVNGRGHQKAQGGAA